jgi:hypothetical protein
MQERAIRICECPGVAAYATPGVVACSNHDSQNGRKKTELASSVQ